MKSRKEQIGFKGDRLGLGLTVLLFGAGMPGADWGVTGPEKGTLVIVGGGDLPNVIVDRFVSLAGGRAARVVVIPTAGEEDRYGQDYGGADFLKKAGVAHVTVLHTRDRAVADTEEFTRPLREATGVWLPGGRHWRFVDSYLHTRTQRELELVLERGGVIGGSSAGATIQGSYMVRGAREGNTILMAPGYEVGFGFMKNATIDQHLLKRKRERDLLEVIARHGELLGIGIDEGTAIVVWRNEFEVIGVSKVAIYEPGKKAFYVLEAGDKLELTKRARER
jgi:cyanophycinase